MHKPNGLPREEKLKSVVRTEKLFTSGNNLWVFPCSVYYRIAGPDEIPASQILVSVGKHYFKHAVDRNRMKRLLREAYRIYKQPLQAASADAGLNYNLGFVYKSRNLLEFAVIENSMKNILAQIENVIRKRNPRA